MLVWPLSLDRLAYNRRNREFAFAPQIGDAWYQHGKLIQYREDLYDGNKKIATKMFANGKWFLDKVSACLNFTIDPQTGEFRYLNEVKCQ